MFDLAALILILFAVPAAIAIAVAIRRWRRDRAERAAYLSSLPPSAAEELRGFELTGKSWRVYRSLENETATATAKP